MNEEILTKILDKLETMDKRLNGLEELTVKELEKVHTAIEGSADQQYDVINALQRIDAKMSAILETQKLNFEILKVFSGDPVQH